MTNIDGPYDRKMQLTGGATYTISLPKAWADEHELDVGSRLRIHPRGERLLVTQPDARDADVTVISADLDETTAISRAITAAYVAGVETIRIVDIDAANGETERMTRAAVRSAVDSLVGLQLTEETDETAVARAMLDADDLSAARTVAQMKRIALDMHADAMRAALTGDEDAGQVIAARDDTIDRLFGLVSREFHRSLGDVAGREDGLTRFEYYTIARQLERTGDHAENVAEAAALIDSPPSDALATRIEDLAAEARDVVGDAVDEMLAGYDPDRLNAVIADGTAVAELAATLDRDLYEQNPTSGYALATVLDSVSRTAEYGVNVAEIGLRAAHRPTGTDPESH
ncbi:PhoU domain-containing protein [Halorubrum sp. DTA46]|uniref:PhoU domain-containing protein n=1 Tax=Halorubrum sp. DTA46 TaxID=3402162 RepID=UPI003AACC591